MIRVLLVSISGIQSLLLAFDTKNPRSYLHCSVNPVSGFLATRVFNVLKTSI